MLLVTCGRLFDAKISGIEATSDKGTDGRLKSASRDVWELHSLKLYAAEF